MHGVVMPIFFPMCLIGLVIIYVTDKLRLAYQYRKPELLSADLPIQISKLLLYLAPFVLAIFSYWHLTNKRIFDNESPIKRVEYERITRDMVALNPLSDAMIHSVPIFTLAIIFPMFCCRCCSKSAK